MRATPSSILPRLAAVASIVASSAGLASAYDAETIGDNLQPYIGGWVGMYQVNTDDLRYLAATAKGTGTTPDLDYFNPMVPAGGVSMGVAYGRLHLGANLGYQMRDGGKLSAAHQSTGLYPDYHYDVIPLDINLDIAVLPNEYPVNLLIGGSLGIGFTRIQNPFLGMGHSEYDTSGNIKSVTVRPLSNEDETNSFGMATGYIGARINLARRLNLEGQVGWRLLRTDALEYDGPTDPAQVASTTYDSLGRIKKVELKPIPIDLSGAYARVDLRWTFASKAEKERSAALIRRRQALERLGQVAFVDPRD